MQRKVSIGIILAFFIGLNGCISDAPRTNPLDPAFEINQKIRIEGKVTRADATTAIADARIDLNSGALQTRSDAAGNFVLEGLLEAGVYHLRCVAPGFSADSAQLTLQKGQSARQDFALNGLPVINIASVLTRHQATFIPPDAYFVDVTVEADDIDGINNIATVWYEIPAMQFKDTLQFISADQHYFKRVTPLRLNIPALEALQGMPLFIHVKDHQGSEAVSGAYYISRIINATPRPLSPNGAATQPVTFRWEPFLQPFAFTYRIEVYPNVNIALPPVAVIDGISSDSTSVTLGAGLFPDAYYWVLYAVDAFGNYSRSVQTALNLSGLNDAIILTNGLIQ